MEYNFRDLLISWGYGCKDIQEIQLNIPSKKFLETLNMFSQPELPGKKRE